MSKRPNRYVYTVFGSEDGLIGAFTSRQSAIWKAAEYLVGEQADYIRRQVRETLEEGLAADMRERVSNHAIDYHAQVEHCRDSAMVRIEAWKQ